MLLLDAPLPERPDPDPEGLPALEIDVRRDDGPEVSAPVGETETVGEAGSPSWKGKIYRPFRSSIGISVVGGLDHF